MTVEDRFWAKVKKTRSCWIWTGAKMGNGYGNFWPDASRKNGYSCLAHRFAYSLLIGPPPPCLDHLCRNRLCVNPKHLESVTLKENILRGNSPFAINARKTHCKNGHPYDGLNTRGTRICKACEARRSARRSLAYYYRQKALNEGSAPVKSLTEEE